MDKSKLMEDLRECRIVDFGTVEPGRSYTQKIKIKSDSLVTRIRQIKNVHPLEQVFSLKRLEATSREEFNRFAVEYKPSLPHHKSVLYGIVEFETSANEKLCLTGKTKGSDLRLSDSKIYFHTNSSSPIAQFNLSMENRSDCCDVFIWDFISEGSEVKITPKSGRIRAKAKIDFFVQFQPSKLGLFYREFPCILKYQEPLYLAVYGFHAKNKMEMDLEKYILLRESLPSFPTNYCRYVHDSADRVLTESRPHVSVSRRYINFGNAPISQYGKTVKAEEIFLTNHADKDLIVEWKSTQPNVFLVEPWKCRIHQNGGVAKFSLNFQPDTPEIFSYAEFHGSLLWGEMEEYQVPYSLTVHVIGDSFTSGGCGWGPAYSIERTRIILPGTIPSLPTYTTFQISRKGPLPLQFTLEPVDKKKKSLFTVKPPQGIITEDVHLVVVQLNTPEKVDVIHSEDWFLILNKFAKVKLELCGTSELPFLLAGWDKNVTFPPTTLGSIFLLQVPVENPTRLELQYKCLASLCPSTFTASKEFFKIGPGEQQYVEFMFRPATLGNVVSTMGVNVQWCPRHSAAFKSLRGRIVQQETVLRLSGTGEAGSIKVTPSHFNILDILLNDVGVGSFILTNIGNSTAYVRLECRATDQFSIIGPWELIPNDITLEPKNHIEVKLNLLGVEKGLNKFRIWFVLYDSPAFRKPTSPSTPLLTGDIFVSYPSIKIEDIRYEGLAKSVSKLAFWNLLRINELNAILDDLQTSRNHYSYMKIPEYHEGSPTLRIQFLLKNTSSLPVWVSVEMRKNCHCKPKRADSISRRVLDFSCPHADQMSAVVRDRILQPGKTTILTIEAEYEVVDNSLFTMDLHVAAAPDKKWMSTTQVEIERGIIPVDKTGLSFLLPKEFGSKTYRVHLEDAYLGIGSFLQVIWLFNHSQLECRYWAEWLMVNNRVFQLVNSKANVPPYSAQPFFIRFTPYEWKNYEAKLAIVNELGDESHIYIEGNGLVPYPVTTYSMLNKMPPVSKFEEPLGELELSVDHIPIRAMPTHSWDKFIFFMKNNSNETISFCWQRLVVWSTLKVVVLPKAGELLPGEIFPVQMHVQTYRNRAVFNFAVECLYYRKDHSVAYFAKSQYATKYSRVFDSCFVLEPDKEIEIAYRNPRLGVKCGTITKNRIISIGGSIKIFNRQYHPIVDQNISRRMSHIPHQKLNLFPQEKESLMTCTGDSFFVCTEALKRIIRSVCELDVFRLNLASRKHPPLRYVDLPSKDKRKRPKMPGREMGMLMANLIYSSLMKLFGLEAIIHHDKILNVNGRKDPNKYFYMFNDYYENMLRIKLDQMTIPPSGLDRARRLQSRENLVYVQRST